MHFQCFFVFWVFFGGGGEFWILGGYPPPPQEIAGNNTAPRLYTICLQNGSEADVMNLRRVMCAKVCVSPCTKDRNSCESFHITRYERSEQLERFDMQIIVGHLRRLSSLREKTFESRFSLN